MFVYLELVENNPFWAHYSKFFKNLVRSSSSISFETVLMKFGSVHGQAHTVSTLSGMSSHFEATILMPKNETIQSKVYVWFVD